MLFGCIKLFIGDWDISSQIWDFKEGLQISCKGKFDIQKHSKKRVYGLKRRTHVGISCISHHMYDVLVSIIESTFN